MPLPKELDQAQILELINNSKEEVPQSVIQNCIQATKHYYHSLSPLKPTEKMFQLAVPRTLQGRIAMGMEALKYGWDNVHESQQFRMYLCEEIDVTFFRKETMEILKSLPRDTAVGVVY